MKQEKSSAVWDFLFLGSLVVPKWREYWWRYLLLLFIGVAVLGLTTFHNVWLHQNDASSTVNSFGITLHPDDTVVDFQEFINVVYRATLLIIWSVYVLLVIAIYGPRRFWQAATRASMKTVACYIVGVGAMLVFGGYLIERFGAYSGDPTNQRTSTTALYLFSVMGPLMEEMFARFTLFQMIRAKFPFWVAATLSSLVFGLLHFGYPEPIKMLMAGISGILLCWTYEKTDSIATPIGIHVLNNLWMLLG